MSVAAAPDIDGLTFIEHLGSGGYSDVYLYERRTPRMRVAVKVLKDVRLSAAETAQFAAEAETMAQLADHPYIVQVFSTGLTVDGRPYLVMKYYPPPNLGERAGRERFSVADVLRTGVKISSAVETAHRAGILHRDIKPANILVSQYGEPGLTDFGIAGHTAEPDAGDDLGVSIPWSPPEVLNGSSNGSARSDVYSLAATLWHLLVGRSPFEVPSGDNSQRALMGRVLRTQPPTTGRADVPASLDRLLQQSMAKNPEVRPRTALEFARALQAVEQEQRFARTEIVVEGLAAPATNTGGRRVDTGTDSTRLRTPSRVVAQPAGPSSFAPPPGPSPYAPPAPAQAPDTERRVPLVDAPPAPSSPPTTVRPARPAAPAVPVAALRSPAATERQRAGMAGQQVEPTTLRPQTPQLPPSDEAPPRRGLRRAHVVIIAAAVVVVSVVVGIIVAAGGSKSPDAGAVTTPPATDQTNLVAPTIDVSATYDAKAKIVHFTWTVTPAQPGAEWAYRLSGSTAPPTRVPGPKADVPSRGDPATTCIVVVLITDGPPVSSQTVCGSAG